jgi:hypothetical protein
LGGGGTIITGTLNIFGDPGFVSPVTGDYHLRFGSAAIDAGINAGVTTDIDGQIRPCRVYGGGFDQSFDLGADEYCPPSTPLQSYLPIVLRSR